MEAENNYSPDKVTEKEDEGEICPDEISINEEGEETDEELSVEEIQGRIHTPSRFPRPIFGARGKTKKRLLKETGCKIKINKSGDGGLVVVTGPSRKQVASARRRIELVISLRKGFVSHFIGFHLGKGNFLDGFSKFKNCKDRGVVEALFMPPGRLHLTLCATTLSTEEEKSAAAKSLKDCHDGIVKPHLNEEIRIGLKGLDCMNANHTNVTVLYAKPYDIGKEGLLQELSDSIKSALEAKGLSSESDSSRRGVKLHVTLMNSKFLRKRKYKTNMRTFDATNIFKNYKDFDFGEATITSLELCEMKTDKDNQYYVVTASADMTLPNG